MLQATPFITNDAVVLGLLMATVGLVFYTSHSPAPYFKTFYRFVPPLLLCYFIPALFNYPFALISPDASKLYTVAKDYFLPGSLILFCMGIDLKAILGLGPKAIIMFLAASVGVMLGGPFAVFVTKYCMPDLYAAQGEQLWQGLATIAGSWIGGAPNQAAMKEIYNVDENIFGTMVVIDVVVSYLWMAILLYGVTKTDKIDKWLKADVSEIEKVKLSTEKYRAAIERVPETYDIVIMLSLCFAGVGLSHWLADVITPFFQQYEATLRSINLHAATSRFLWVVLLATTLGFALSFTNARKLEGVGASKWGTAFIYLLVTTIGMQMNIKSVFGHLPLLLVGLIWISFHIVFIFVVAKIIKAPFFFLAVGSQANIGGPASAPIVAAAFSPSLAPLGIILAVLGYALGTYGALICAHIMGLV